MDPYPRNPYITNSQLSQQLNPPQHPNLNPYHNNYPPQPLTAQLIYPSLPARPILHHSQQPLYQSPSLLLAQPIPQAYCTSPQKNTEYILFITQTIQTKRMQNSNDRLCPHCNYKIGYPVVKKVVGNVSLSYSLCLFLTTCICFLFPLLCCDNCKDVELLCEKCGWSLGTIKAQCC